MKKISALSFSLLLFGPFAFAGGKMTTSMLLKQMAEALGGASNINKIHSIYYKSDNIVITAGSPLAGMGVQIPIANTQVKVWLTSDGKYRAVMRSAAMQVSPVVTILSPGEQSVTVPVNVTSAMGYTPLAGGQNCSKTRQNPLCANALMLTFNLGYIRSHRGNSSVKFSAVQPGFSGPIVENDNCGSIASVSASSVKGIETYTVTAKSPGKCSIVISTDAPEGWMLVADQGFLGTSSGSTSTGQMSGPDLERLVSGVYWQTFAYLTRDGIPGKVEYKAEPGKPYYLLEMNPYGGVPIKAHIDKTTYLPDEMQTGDETDPARIIYNIRKWTTVGGVKFPSEMVVNIFNPAYRTPAQAKYTFVKIELNVKTPKDFFAQPTPAI